MTKEINKHHLGATELFNNACKEKFGIHPLEDDHMILMASVQFGSYIKTFERIDLTTSWHRIFVDTMVKNKIDTLEQRINKKYGSLKRYTDRMRRRSRSCKEENKTNSKSKQE
jgi:hypothetical protein